jgi:hypothetical protein
MSTDNKDGQVVIIQIDNVDSFIDLWNRMNSNIKEVSIIVHSRWNVLLFGGGTSGLHNDEIGKLSNKSIIGGINLISCNSAHQAHINDNLAATFIII